jgi:hypothetical protein
MPSVEVDVLKTILFCKAELKVRTLEQYDSESASRGFGARKEDEMAMKAPLEGSLQANYL